MLELRTYQQEAVAACYDYLRRHDGKHPCIVAPTASGKSLLIAQLVVDAVQRWQGRVLVLSHVKELLEQNADKIRRLCPDIPVGLHSAGLKQRDLESPVIVAGIQSVFRKACDLGSRDLIIVDECHTIPAEGLGMYGQFLNEARIVTPHQRVIGLTASPYRMDSGLIYGPGKIFDDVCYEISIKRLIEEGFLSPLISKASAEKVDTSELVVRSGEFAAAEAEALMLNNNLVQRACAEIMAYTAERKKVLIFTAGVAHGKQVEQELRERHGAACAFITGSTPAAERAEIIARYRDEPLNLFRSEPLKYLINVNVLTTGFDAPATDCVVLLFPTKSVVKYVQTVGRGFRLAPGKKNCLVLDYGNNIVRHGPVDQPQVKNPTTKGDGEAPAKICPECQTVVPTGTTECPDCHFIFPPPAERDPHEAEAASEGILTGQVSRNEYAVRDVTYSVHVKRNASSETPRTMRVTYDLGSHNSCSEWICFEHTGYARQKAEAWWRKRSLEPVPFSTEEAVELADAGALAVPERITIRSVAGEPYDRIVAYELGPLPPAYSYSQNAASDIPF